MNFERLDKANIAYHLHWLDQMDSALAASLAASEPHKTNTTPTTQREKSRDGTDLALTKQSNLSNMDNGQSR